jgi:class 3 adenylate cyclase
MDEATCERGGVVQGFPATASWRSSARGPIRRRAPTNVSRGALLAIEAAGDQVEVKHGLRPQLRTGLNTGAAIVGKVRRSTDAGAKVLGDTVNVAGRLQTLAQPDSSAHE